jgi:hypothetical protein
LRAAVLGSVEDTRWVAPGNVAIAAPLPVWASSSSMCWASSASSVTELAKPFAMSQPAISKRAGLIARGPAAHRRPCRIAVKPLAEISAWLEGYRQFWEQSFERLDALLDEMKLEEIRAKRRGDRR